MSTALEQRIWPRSLRDWSLGARLLVFFSLLLLAAWLTAAGLAWRESRDYINAFFDTQQVLFAKTLITAEWETAAQRLPRTKPLLRGAGKKAGGKEDKDALAFAVFTRDGRVLLTDGAKGDSFRFEPQRRGFRNIRVDGDDWRIFWVASPDGGRVAAVGQERDYRRDMALDMLGEQMLPWLLLFPVLTGGLWWMLHRELRPLHRVAEELAARPPQDARPLAARPMPPEVRPLVAALNSLFARTGALLQRERAFVADAAHELRTPLAGLRVQAEVVQLYVDDAAAREHAVQQLLQGLERCSRLVEQLLTLSRLDGVQSDHNIQNMPDLATRAHTASLVREAPQWEQLLEQALAGVRPQAKARSLRVQCTVQGVPAPAQGYPALWEVLLRNVLDNAAKYTPAGGWIKVTLDCTALTVENSGPGVPQDCLPRLGERFFRPPGQDATGSGLGLAMVRHIAEVHACTLTLENTKDDAAVTGFRLRLLFPC